VAWNNLLNYFAGGTINREMEETRAQWARVKGAFDASEYTDDRFRQFRVDLILDICRRAERIPIGPLVNGIGQLIGDLVDVDFLLYGLPDPPQFHSMTASEGVELRTYLKRKERFLTDPERLHALWSDTVASCVAGLLGRLPATLFKEDWDDPDPDPEGGVTVPLIDLLEQPADGIERLFGSYHKHEVLSAELFPELREHFDRRVCVASGIEWHERHTSKRKVVRPSEWKSQQPSLLAETYLGGTPWLTFLETSVPFSIPFPVRFEHTHIVGGSGHGKTQLLQLEILRDLEASVEDGRSVVVIDSQGDLIRTISRLSLFAPGADLSDRLLIVDPTDVEYPVALNMFDFDRGSLEKLPLIDRERVLNATIDLYEYFFGALLGAELTARQGIIFKYIARLLLEVPDATIHTLRELMEDGEPFRPFMEMLPPTARAFFETRFFDRTFNETKKQVLTRLWGVLSNATFDRMFSHPRSKVDMNAAMQGGKIVLVNTSKELLGHEGASILGRFFIALIAQAAQRRATLPAHERNPTFVYIDEAADYFDTTIDHLLNQARKYKVGMVLAHQNLDQLSTSLRASVFASTSVKYAGGVSSRDATAFASEMKSERDFLESMRKRERTTTFACYVRNVTPQALAVSVPLGVVEREEQMSDDEWAEVLESNRRDFCIPISDVPPATFRVRKKASPRDVKRSVSQAASTEPSNAEEQTADDSVQAKQLPPTFEPLAARKKRASRHIDPDDTPALGRGGREHTYLQNLIKEFALSKGFKAVIEEPILDGGGQVDVAISLKGVRIACEISVTTGRDHELANIEKCVAAGFQHVLFIARDARHRDAMARATRASLDERDHKRVRFLDPEGALEFVAALAPEASSEATIRGYKVKVSHAVVEPGDAERRRANIAGVIARSLKRE
jgi:hypothetical protein